MKFLFQKRTRLCSPNAGFTLIEMIVAVFLFTVVMVVATAALATVINANRRVQGAQNVMNNLNFALDSMTRSIRTGNQYCTGATCADGASSFSFVDTDGNDVTYRLSQDADGHGFIERSNSSLNVGAFVPLTAPEVDVKTLEFYVAGEGAYANGDTNQPHVLILVRGTAGETVKTTVPFDIETIVTQRILDRGTAFTL
jgi:prepilin-type N-terminal cleavage/methylation domain-containing protein